MVRKTAVIFSLLIMIFSRLSQTCVLARWGRRASVSIPHAFNRLSAPSSTAEMRNMSSVRAASVIRLPAQRLFTTTSFSHTTSTAHSLVGQIQNWLSAQSSNQSIPEIPLEQLMGFFNKDGKLPKDLVIRMLDTSIAEHRELPNVLQISRCKSSNTSSADDGTVHPKYTGKLTIVGDTHGQYEDFAQIFEYPDIGGYPSAQNQFVFNGDIVDRGPKAVEILMTLLFAKLENPTSVHILRGNHETAEMSNNFGFSKEVLQKYDRSVWEKFTEFFDTLPIAAVVENSAFVVHGGIGPQSVSMSIEELNKVDRFSEPDFEGPISELLWSDPKDQLSGFKVNKARGGGTVNFGANVTQAFLARNKLDYIVRSHEVQMQGYSVLHEGLCITVFSAPNYCGEVGNLGAVLRYDQPDSMEPGILQFAPASYIKAQQAAKLKSDENNAQ